MFYVKCPKGRMQVDHSRIGITRENVFALCRVCGREVKIDIEEYTIFNQMRIDTIIECDECRERRMKELHQAKDKTGYWTPADNFREAFGGIQIGYVSTLRSKPDPRFLNIKSSDTAPRHGIPSESPGNSAVSSCLNRKHDFGTRRFAAKKEDSHERK